MKTPFKFLDAYQYQDRDAFFGRDKEIDRLYNLVFQSSLVIVYGLSGTGKSSLVQCGLANRFDGPEWLPLLVRRQSKDLLESLNEILDKTLGTSKPETGGISEKIQALYVKYFRRVYLIFDQFEEIFIDGTEEEQKRFYQNIQKITSEQLPCTCLFIIREEYLGYLYPMEQVLPSLFDFRLRVEPMTEVNVRSVLKHSFEKFNIHTEPPTEDRFTEIISNITRSREGTGGTILKSFVELPYLQVYLDRLYKEDFKRAYPGVTEISQPWPPLELTKDEIANFGKIDDVLEDFLLEQQLELKAAMAEKYPELPEDMVRSFMLTFISERGTKRPLRVQRVDGIIVLDDFIRKKVSRLIEKSGEEKVAGALTLCVNRLEAARLLRDNGQTLELAHDSLAAIIDRQRTGEERRIAELKRMVQAGRETWAASNEYLTPGQLSRLDEDLIPQMELEEEDLIFVAKSREEADLKRQAERRAAEQRALEAEAQAQKEREARQIADEAKEAAIRAREAAERQRKKTTKYFRIAGLFGIATFIALIIAGSFYDKVRRTVIKVERSEQQIREARAKELLSEALKIQATADSLTEYPEVRQSLLIEAFEATAIDTLDATDTVSYLRKLRIKRLELDSLLIGK
jgi:KaiC/GvpD/RAD55 family RecA-like ATPase